MSSPARVSLAGGYPDRRNDAFAGLLPAKVQSPQISPHPSPLIKPKGPEIHDLLVMKFGGSSLAGAEHMRRVAGIIRDRQTLRPIVVLSAIGKTTNELIAAAERALETGVVDDSKVRELHSSILSDLGLAMPDDISALLQELNRVLSGISLLREISSRTRDLIVSFGERLSVRLFAAYFNASREESTHAGLLVEAQAFDSWELGMLTTCAGAGSGSSSSAHSAVAVLESSYAALDQCLGLLRLRYTHMPVVTGYIAKDESDVITTLGRDGSDLSATVIGAAVRASEVQIWKDVSGVLTADPRLIPAAKPVRVVTFEEAAELSYFGAKVVHPAAVLPAWLASVPITVRNSTMPGEPGTRIVANLDGLEEDREGRVTAISCKRGITMIVIRSTRMLGQHGFLARVFQLFDEYEASVDVIATSEVTVSLTLDKGFKDVNLEGLRKALETIANVTIHEGMAMMTLIAMKCDLTAVLCDSFAAFRELGVTVELVSHGASNVNITFLLQDVCLLDCVRKLHQSFIEN